MDAGGVFVVFWFLGAVGVAYLADSRGRSGIGFLLLSAVFSPLLGLIVVLVSANLRLEEAKAADQRREHERQLESIRAIATANNSTTNPDRGLPMGRSTADELIKLAELRDKGILTEQEFLDQKVVLLSTAKAEASA